jgi:hypothetical protein
MKKKKCCFDILSDPVPSSNPIHSSKSPHHYKKKLEKLPEFQPLDLQEKEPPDEED